ncbi:diguanylate cyclase [Ornithinibacillus sp. L9]|uniref:Diguanylate cyclase n=1 Tax=Ornithinibacillus caprae TaxID=2678566 RepID=A0A6N8FCD7_9BACI|nr:diguanylate cyclase [Ornithinibacillus caprae]MUK86831.1 diguanylate cyclase [Ornithinibacillus caprae]
MKRFQNLAEKIRSSYFTLLTDTHDEKEWIFYTELTSLLERLLNVSYIGFYKYNHWNNSFLLMNEKNNYIKVEINDHDHYYKEAMMNNTCQTFHQDHDIIKTKDLSLTYATIPLQPKIGPVCFLLIQNDATSQLQDDVLPIIKTETEKVLNIINDMNIMGEREKKEQFLLERTSQFFSTSDKNKILKEILESIKKIYPTFSHYLLLSQDYDHNSSLPIKALEYSDDSTKRVSSQAFISGEIQIEDRLLDKKTYMYAPLKGKQGIYGVLQIITPSIVEFPDFDIEFIKRFADTAGKAIENVTLYQDSKHLVADLKLINEITHQLNSNLNLREITKVVKNQIINICHASQLGFIYVNKENNHSFEVLDGSTSYFESIEGRSLFKYLWDQLLKTKDAIFAGEFQSELNIPYRSVMAVPMQHSGTITGIVIILHEQPYFFSFDNFKFIQSLVQHSTLALANTILKEQLEKAVHTDYLTKLYARSYLDEKIRDHMETGEMGTLILFDIDDFKKVNDTHGHYIGDEVIKQIAEIILTNIEDEDVAARWGGEELAIYLPNTTLNDGVQIAGVISKQVANFTSPSVTLSAGVSSWSNKSNDTAKRFFVRADKALYEAKSYGKNCVVKKSQDEEEPVIHE